jgi:hypothetical protein
MADGHFPTLVSKDTGANAVANPIWTQLTDGTTAVSITSNALDVNVDNTVTISATNLDIRPLQAGETANDDNILIFANTAKDGTGTDYVPLVDADGKLIISNPGGTTYTEDAVAADPASGPAILAERDDALAGITPAEGDWSKLYVNANGALWVKQDGTANVDIQDSWAGLTGAGTEAGVLRVTIANDSTGLLSVDDNGSSLTVDALDLDIRNLNLTDDAVKVSANSTANSITNPIYVHNVKASVTSTEVADYATSTGTGNNDYTVAGTSFLLSSVIFAASGGMKVEIQTGPLATLVTKAVGFIPHQGGTNQLFFDPPIEVPVTSTGTVRVIMTNREGSSMDVYSTIIGNDLP